MINEKQKKNYSFLILIIGLVIFFGGMGATYYVVKKYPDFFKTIETKVQKKVTITDSGIADAVEKVYDSVVVVTAYKGETQFSSGTGFVYKKEGNDAYILTNNHVINGGDSVTVTFTDGSVVKTILVGKNELSDIAVLKVEAKKVLSVSEIGSSEDLRVGDTAFTVGAPIDSVYSWTVTRGIISGKDRMVEVKLSNNSMHSDYVMKVLQTDAAINSGNSGGPLCNSNGEVVGITSLKLVDTSVEGMGFAIPIETAINHANMIVAGKVPTQPYLGVGMSNVSDVLYSAQYYNILRQNGITKGVIVISVEENSPADKAGVRAGDIVTKINDHEITSIAYLRYYLYSYKVGDTVNLSINRDGKEKKLKVILTSNPSII
ncbi:MAG: PDZ domain-containing protein [Mollicutes bacterium]|nr:PDZ domain-containing protein [Mollicutes bacterium]